MFCTFLVSCQTELQSENFNSKAVIQVQNNNTEKIDTNTSEIGETQPLASSTALLKTTDINSKVGIVDVNNVNIICLRTDNANLAENSQISIIVSPYEIPQKIVKAFVGKKLNYSCAAGDSEAGEEDLSKTAYYTLKLDGNDIDESYIGAGIAILDSSKPIKFSDGLANVDLNNDGKNEYFRQCASNEGLHLTVWTGKPLIGKRIWHKYYYLKYDTEADCKKKDWEGTDD